MASRITHLFGNDGLAYAPRLLNVKTAHRTLVHQPVFFFSSPQCQSSSTDTCSPLVRFINSEILKNSKKKGNSKKKRNSSTVKS
jgi:hypothetical protein